jgi:hypothetical protein
VVKDQAGQPVDFHSPNHFCVGCHYKAAVTIDCFECHNSKPTQQGQASLAAPRLAAIPAPQSLWSVIP